MRTENKRKTMVQKKENGVLSVPSELLLTAGIPLDVYKRQVESYDGRFFGVRSHTGLYHRVSPWRMFRTREEAVETLSESKEQGYGGMTLG